jgi:hypothetical protein
MIRPPLHKPPIPVLPERTVVIRAPGPEGDPGATGPPGADAVYSNATPQALGTAAEGVVNEASRADHVHQMPTAAQVPNTPAGGIAAATVQAALNELDTETVKLTGDQSVGGIKTFTSDPLIPDEAYGVGWNGSLEPPTKNAVYDKIETIGGGYTDEQAQDAVGTILADSATIDFTYTDVTPEITASVKDNSIGVGKMTASATDRLFGRDTAGAGAGEELAPAAVRAMLDLEVGTDLQAYSANLDEYAAVNPTAAGLALLDDADAAAQRTTLGLDIGTNVQAYSANLDEYAGVNPTAAGLAILDDADAAAQRTTLGLAIGANVQAYSANLDEYAAVNPTAAGLALLDDADAAAQRTTLGLVIGTNVQAYSANLDEYAGVNPTAAGLALLDDADAAAQLVTLGTAAVLTAAKTAQTDRASTTVFAADPHLTRAMVANRLYKVDIFLNYTTGAGGLKVQFTGPASATAGMTNGHSLTATVGGFGVSTTVLTGAATNQGASFRGWVRTGATAGNFVVEWAQNSSNVANSSLLIGSHLTLIDLGAI